MSTMKKLRWTIFLIIAGAKVFWLKAITLLPKIPQDISIVSQRRTYQKVGLFPLLAVCFVLAHHGVSFLNHIHVIDY